MVLSLAFGVKKSHLHSFLVRVEKVPVWNPIPTLSCAARTAVILFSHQWHRHYHSHIHMHRQHNKQLTAGRCIINVSPFLIKAKHALLDPPTSLQNVNTQSYCKVINKVKEKTAVVSCETLFLILILPWKSFKVLGVPFTLSLVPS